MTKKIVSTVLLLGILAAALILIIPRLDAQQYGPKQTEMERLQRELTQRIDSMTKTLNDMERTLDWIKRKVDDIDRKIK